MGGQGDILGSFDKSREKAPVVKPVYPRVEWQGKTVLRMDTRKLGMAVVALGGGRTFSGQSIDHAVGCADWIRPGEICAPDHPIAFIHARDEAGYEVAAKRILEAIEVGVSPAFATSNPIIKNFKV
jgi:thymidine phosphorylase